MQSWDIDVRGKRHRVEFGVNEATGRRFVRVGGRMAAPPFIDAERDIELDIDGETWIARVRGDACSIEKIADAVRPAPVGLMTSATTGNELVVVCDDAILSIDLSRKGISVARAAGGLVGAMLIDRLQRMETAAMPGKIVRDFISLDEEVETTLSQLPYEVVTEFPNVDLDSKALVIPRGSVVATSLANGLTIETRAQRARGDEPYKLELAGKFRSAVRDHLCSAGYAMSASEIAQAGTPARTLRERTLGDRRALAAAPTKAAPIAAPAPPPKSASAGLRRIKPLRILVTDLGKDVFFQALADEDVKRIQPHFPRTKHRKSFIIRFLFEEIAKREYDVLYLLAQCDEKGRFKETGATISLRDLITRCKDAGMRMVWLAGPSDPQWVGDTLDWASGLEFNVVMMRDRTPAYFAFLDGVMRRLASGTPLGESWKEAKEASPGNAVVVLSGPTDVIFVPRL